MSTQVIRRFMKFIPVKTERLVIRKTLLKDVDLLLKIDKQEITQKYLGGIKNKTRKERLEFFILNCFRTFVENQFMIKSKVLFLDSQFCAIELYSFSMPDLLSKLVCYGKI